MTGCLSNSRAVDAVRCAVEIQRGITVRNANVPPDKRIEFRMGINIGDVIEDAGDVFGDGVNVAARLEGIAPRGGICISRHVLDIIEGKVELACRELGRQNLKNIARPVEVYGVDIDGEGSLAARVLAQSDLKQDVRYCTAQLHCCRWRSPSLCKSRSRTTADAIGSLDGSSGI